MPKQPKRPRPRKRAAKSAKPLEPGPPESTQAKAVEAAIGAGTQPLSSLVAEVLDSLRLPTPAKPLPAGTVGTEIPINVQTLQRLVTAAATQDSPGQQFWVKDTNELLVITGKVSVILDDGLVILMLPVSCDQAEAVIQVPFAVGGKEQPAGFVFATEERPRGPQVIVDTWGEALIAFAWRLLLNVSTRMAAHSGLDEDGAGLIPIALTATKEALILLPMARHSFDRVRL